MNRYATLALAGLVCSGLLAVYALHRYGGETLWPELAASFGGTFIAFMLALVWERERERAQELAASERRRVQAVEEASRINEENKSEVRRRLETIRAELAKNRKSLEDARGLDTPLPGRTFGAVNPQLLEGAWTASAPRLAELIADYGLVADLATAYGRLEELRWRLRVRTEQRAMDLDGMTAPLVEELRREVADLLDRIVSELKNPTVQAIGRVHVKS